MQQLILGLAIFVAGIAWFSCWLWYTITAKWWRTPYGVNTWVVTLTVAVALFRLMILVLFPDTQGTMYMYIVGLATYVALFFTGFQRLYLIRKAQKEGERERLAIAVK